MYLSISYYYTYIMKKRSAVVQAGNISQSILPPKLANNPSWDVVVTETTPLLSFFNAQGGYEKRAYEIELDTVKTFDSAGHSVFPYVEEDGGLVSAYKIRASGALHDHTRYYWRVRTVTDTGKSQWAVSRFYVDTTSDDHFMDLVRVPIDHVEVSGGYNAKNIIDYDDPGLVSFWQSPPPGEKHPWVLFELAKPTIISRFWILSTPDNPDGWLKEFVFQKSMDGTLWEDVEGSMVKGNDTFRNSIDVTPFEARFVRLLMYDFIGYCAQINEVILYSPGKPAIPDVPDSAYVLIVGNEHNGYTFTELAQHIEGLGLALKTVTVPYFEVSMDMIRKVTRKPVAIILSGNNADYPNLPMFEYSGEFEIIRECDIPILGICAGHQFLAMAYGYTRARSMGYADITAMEPERKWTHVDIIQKDPIFDGITDHFVSPEIHGWAVAEPGDDFEIIAQSSYIQAVKHTKRVIYGEQFHAEIQASYNHGRHYIKNFLEMALRR